MFVCLDCLYNVQQTSPVTLEQWFSNWGPRTIFLGAAVDNQIHFKKCIVTFIEIILSALIFSENMFIIPDARCTIVLIGSGVINVN